MKSITAKEAKEISKKANENVDMTPIFNNINIDARRGETETAWTIPETIEKSIG